MNKMIYYMYDLLSKIKNNIIENGFAKTFITIGIFAVIFCIIYYLGKEVGALFAFMIK